MNTSKEFTWIPFHVVACNSEDYQAQAEYLSIQQYNSQKAWECSRTADFPIELIIRFHYRVQLDHILIGTKYDKGIPSLDFLIGDGLSGGFLDAQYRLAGQQKKYYHIKQVLQLIKLQGIGSFLKLKFSEKPKRSPQNPYGQISINVLKVWGCQRSYLSNIKNEQIELVGARDSIDKMLIDMGIPVDMLNWFEEDDRNFQYAPVDEESRMTLNELKRIRDQALKVNDFEALKQLKKDMRLVFDIGKELFSLKRELGHVVAKEDFTRAIELRDRIKRLEEKRDSFDALYETSRYEMMIALKRPSTAEYLRNLELLDAQERMNADALRRQRELEEQQRRKIVKDEQDRLGLQGEEGLDKTPWWDKVDQGKRVTKKKKKEVKQDDDDQLLNFNNPFAFNEGDVDLELYVNPLLSSAGEKLPEIPIELLRRLHQLGYLTVFGARAWTGIHAESWRIREAVAQAVLNFLEMPLPDKYLNGKSKKLFLASMEFAKIAMEDKILSIYFIGLKILSTALAPPVCGTDVSPQIINKVMKEFTPALLGKIEELNFRARDISLHTLLSIYRHPASKIGILVIQIQSCLDKCIMDPNFPTLFVPPDKQPQRVMLAKLEVVLNVLQEFGYDQREYNYQDVFFILSTPCLFHPSNEVRLLSIEVIAALYQLVGVEIRLMVDSIQNLKPGLREQIIERLDQVDVQLGRPKGSMQKELSLVMEQDGEHEDVLDQSSRKQQQMNSSKEFIPNQQNQVKNNSQVIENNSQQPNNQISNSQLNQSQVKNNSQTNMQPGNKNPSVNQSQVNNSQKPVDNKSAVNQKK